MARLESCCVAGLDVVWLCISNYPVQPNMKATNRPQELLPRLNNGLGLRKYDNGNIYFQNGGKFT